MRLASKQLADIMLGQPVEQWLRDRRDSGASLRAIATELSERTNGRVSVSHQAISKWLRESDEREEKSA